MNIYVCYFSFICLLIAVGVMLTTESPTDHADPSLTLPSPNTTKVVGPLSWIPRRCDYHLHRSISRYNQSIFQQAQTLITSIKRLVKPDRKFSDIPQYVLNKTLIEPISAIIGDRCRWCVENSNSAASLLQLIQQRVNDWNSTVLGNLTVHALDELEQTVNQYFNKSWVQAVGAPVLTSDVQYLRNIFQNFTNTVKYVLKKTDAIMSDAHDASLLTKDIMSQTWKLECNGQLSKSMDEYSRFHKTSESIIGRFKHHIHRARADVQAYINKYTTGEALLEDISKTIKFKDYYTRTREARLKTTIVFNKGIFITKNMKNLVNQINYNTLSYTDKSYLKSKSEYWKQMRIVNPTVQLPRTRIIRNIIIPEMGYGMVPENESLNVWDDSVQKLSLLDEELNRRMLRYDKVMAVARKYFEAYTKGNQVDDDFYL